jgi:hypothetical protein
MSLSPDFLRRYLELPALVALLQDRALTLLSPRSWEDQNDSHFLELYRERRQLSCLLAACFTQVPETFHHWRVFAHGSSGVCVSFHRDKLSRALLRVPGVSIQPVQYFTLEDRRRAPIRVEQLPFMKRSAFRDEAEVRVLFASSTAADAPRQLPVPLNAIARITLSPLLPSALRHAMVTVIRSIPGCQRLSIARSTLLANDQWKALGAGAIDAAP